jgi:hypothetical protein
VLEAFSLLAGELLNYTQASMRLYHILFQETGEHEDDISGATPRSSSNPRVGIR